MVDNGAKLRGQVRAAIYSRVSTLDQQPENQTSELQRFAEVRGWTVVEYVDRGVSGAKERRPALDRLMTDAKRRKFDVLICWRLDRLGRSLKHLIMLLDELNALGDRVRESRGGDRRHDTGREAAAPHPGGHRRI